MTYACIELVIWVNDDHGAINGVVLKKRDAKTKAGRES
jgi:hypothetical protein